MKRWRAILKNMNVTDNPLVTHHPLFAGLDAASLSKALDLLHAEKAVYKKGDFLKCTGERMPHFGLILSGAVQVCEDDFDGNRMIMAEVAEGATFGESLCFLKTEESPVYIYASKPTEVLWLTLTELFTPESRMHDISAEKRELIRQLEMRFTTLLARRTLSMNSRIQVLSKLKLRDKLITYFTEQAGAAGSDTFTLSMNRDDMASYMGTNRSALSRELARMKADGLIDFYRNTFRILKS